MSGSGRNYTRRSVAIGGGVAVALGLAAVGINAPRWFRAKTAYDDLLYQLIDRDEAITIGREAQAIINRYNDVGTPFDSPEGLAEDLRKRLAGRKLQAATREDIVQGRIVEVRGWVLPLTLVMFCLLAAKVS